MEMRMDIIGDEIVVESQVVGVLKPGLGSSMRQHVEDSLRGLILEDWDNRGTVQQVEDQDEYKERVTDFVKFVRGLLKRGREGRRELATKANARVNELKKQLVKAQGGVTEANIAQWSEAYNALKVERDNLEQALAQWMASHAALGERLERAEAQSNRHAADYFEMRDQRDEARAWAESAVRQAWDQGVAYGQQVSFTCGGR